MSPATPIATVLRNHTLLRRCAPRSQELERLVFVRYRAEQNGGDKSEPDAKCEEESLCQINDVGPVDDVVKDQRHRRRGNHIANKRLREAGIKI
jgi:hypothetical protein